MTPQGLYRRWHRKQHLLAELQSLRDWFGEEPEFATTAQQREAYATYLVERLNGPRAWLQEAIAAQHRGPTTLQRRMTHRHDVV